ncbi:spore germination protein [Sulfoacidibacillus thermotolerans]|uniref:Spore germination protein n=1 Tax=Sulfoacidibacillus thermotolerans TaxID=1765684 RepID=A0A2U3D8I9_SULT2|nr:spore germination protein [Sulfoacidibacillus thermotolerans]
MAKVQEWIEQEWHPCTDLQFRTLRVNQHELLLVWIQGLVAKEYIQSGILQPLLSGDLTLETLRDVADHLQTVTIDPIHTLDDCNVALEDGKVVISLDGQSRGLAVDVSKIPGRSLEKAENEPTLHGPQEAFVENAATNISLLRKRIRSPRLKIETYILGSYSKTSVSILYIEGITKPALLTEMRERLLRIHTDMVHDLNDLQEYIADEAFTLFPLTEETERPERVAANLLQGRAGIIADGSPFCLMVPATFVNFLTSPDDYYMQYSLVLPLRVLRHVMYWISILLPAMYVALLTYNQDLLPTPLLISVTAQHAGIPFPTVVEALLMLAAFEALREAGTRLPRAVGQSVSIVGTLIIGDAAVRAGLVSPGIIIAVASTGVASFTLPALGLVSSSRNIQFLFVIVAGLLGLYGILLLGMLLVGHLVSLRSFGVPYMSPIAPMIWSDMKDVVIRSPWWAMKRRPRQFEPQNPVRSDRMPPGPKQQKRI